MEMRKNMNESLRKMSLVLVILVALFTNMRANDLGKDKDQEMTLIEAIEQIGRKYEVYFTFDMTLVADIKVHFDEFAYEKVEDAISGVLSGTDLAYKLYDRRYVIIYEVGNDGLQSLKNMAKHLDGLISDGERSKKEANIKSEVISRLAPRTAKIDLRKPGIDIRGIVTDESGEPLIGATVLVKGLSSGTATDLDGKFELLNVDENVVLIISYTGFQTVEVPVEGKTMLEVTLFGATQLLDELIVVGYGTVKKSDLTGAVERISGDDFKTQSMTQLTEMLSGTVAGFSANQGTMASGGASMEVRGPNSLTASTTPLIVLDGVIYNGSLQDINPNDIETIDILKDASSAAIYGSRAASGVIQITTKKGDKGKPVISFSTKTGVTSNYNVRKGLGPEEYIEFRQDYFRQAFPDVDFDFYTNPNNLPGDLSREDWISMSNAPLPDVQKEWLSRLRFTSVESSNYLEGKTIDPYSYVFRSGLRQDYDLSISGGTDNATYYWSVGYVDNEGIIVGDQYSGIRSRLNTDFQVADWLNVGVNAQFSDRDQSAVPASLNFYEVSPYGQFYEDDGTITRYPHGQYTENPLLENTRTNEFYKTNSLFSNLYANVKLPLGFNFRVSFQPRYEATKNFNFTNISETLGAINGEISSGSREESSTFGWMLDNVLTWDKSIGVHDFKVTLLANSEESKFWRSTQSSRDFTPNQELNFHGLQFGTSPTISNGDARSTGDALMARLNYSLHDKYLITASVRRDGYSAFGNENPRATFPSAALAWVLSEEDFFNIEGINRLKLRMSWGANGNREIGTYASLAQLGASLWFDGNNTRVGVNTTTLANYGLKWEKTTALNFGVDIAFLENRVSMSIDAYDMTTTDLLVDRQIPKITGFSNITSNLGELGNRGLELSINSTNVSKPNLTWKSNLVFSLNRNKVNKLFGDVSAYRLLGEQRNGDVPDFSNGWFPGQAIDVVWDYEIQGVYQENEIEEAAKFELKPGDYKVTDVDGDFRYVDLNDKKFIGFESPRFRIGLRNEFRFLERFTANVFIRSDLGHIGKFRDAMNAGYGIYDRVNRPSAEIPYWTPENGNAEYPGLTPNYEGFGGTLLVYKPRSFVRIQDLSIAYDIPASALKLLKLTDLNIYIASRNLATFSKWPGWDPESLSDPMPRTFTFGLNCSL